MLSGFGSIEAGKRDGNVMELERLMGCHLTMYQNSGDRSKGQVPLGGRKREYDPDQRSMIIDENLLGFENKEMEVFGTFTDAYINQLLDEGVNLGREALVRCNALPTKFGRHRRYFDYSILAFKKHLSVNPLRRQGGDEMVDEDDFYQDDGNDDDDDDDDNSQQPHVPIEQMRPEIRRHYVLNTDVDSNDKISLHDGVDASETLSISSHGPPTAGIATQEQDLDPDGDAEAVGSFLQEVQEEEAINLVQAAFIQESVGASSEGPENISASSESSTKKPYLIKDYDGSMIDARPLLAAINKNILNKCTSNNRVDKVKSVLKGKDDDPELHEDNDTQSFTLGSFGAFCFEDADVSGGFRFWIGQIDKILKVRNGKKERIFHRVPLTAKTQKEMLLCCSWLQPILPPHAGKDEVLKAKEYVYCPTSENKEYISAEFLRYIVQMEDSHQKQYKTIDSNDLDMLGTIIAAKASEEIEQQRQQPISIETATEKEQKQQRRNKSNT
jgi:hypothetical protein